MVISSPLGSLRGRCPISALGLLLYWLLLGLWSPAGVQAQDDPLGADKAKHFAASSALALVGYGGSATFLPDYEQRLAAGMSFSLAFGIGKEVYDGLSGTGTASAWDLAWDGIGALTGGLLALLVDYLLREPAPPPTTTTEAAASTDPFAMGVTSHAYWDAQCSQRPRHAAYLASEAGRAALPRTP